MAQAERRVSNDIEMVKTQYEAKLRFITYLN